MENATEEIGKKSTENLEKVQKEIGTIKAMSEENKEMYQNYLIPAFRTSIIDPEMENYPIPGSSLMMVSFSDFIDSKDIELRKEQELRNANNMVEKMLRYSSITDLPGPGMQIVTAIRNLNTNEFSVVLSKEVKAKLKSGELRLVKEKVTNRIKAQLRNEKGEFTDILELAKKIRVKWLLMFYPMQLQE